MDPGIHWCEAENNPYRPSGEAWGGPETVLNELFLKLADDWDGFAIHPAVVHDAGDVVVMEGRDSGTHEKTGNTLDTQVCHIWTVENGRSPSSNSTWTPRGSGRPWGCGKPRDERHVMGWGTRDAGDHG